MTAQLVKAAKRNKDREIADLETELSIARWELRGRTLELNVADAEITLLRAQAALRDHNDSDIPF
ncbi:MAG: hypothetical protein LRY54_04135 [Alphaproteobacteria bacterium]|nr:hypothetical protein [Alphaproteobacteria bacterium]